VINCRIRRPRDAPNAIRTEISGWRLAAWDSIMPAMLAETSRMTRPIAPSSISSPGLTSLTTSSVNGAAALQPSGCGCSVQASTARCGDAAEFLYLRWKTRVMGLRSGLTTLTIMAPSAARV
jgi:hypothetical protein